jgi:hypothetical protein
VTLSGGTASLADINLSDSLQVFTGPTGAATYNAATGVVTATGQNQSLMLGSTSSDTVTSLEYANSASDGGTDGYTVFIGFVTPEPSSATLLFIGMAALWLAGRRRTPRRTGAFARGSFDTIKLSDQ